VLPLIRALLLSLNDGRAGRRRPLRTPVCFQTLGMPCDGDISAE
jgi:hypothetical protein